MNPFSQLHELPRQLRHPAVRDLAWTLLSAPLLQHADWPQRHPLSASTWAQAPDLLADWLRQQEHDSGVLEQWLARTHHRRLGLYYEQLWQFALHAAPGVELLAANLAIREEGRTLGELDVVIRDAEGDHHLELAIKLYLGPAQSDGEAYANWLGPGRHDCLGRKLDHLRLQQLPLSSSPQALAALSNWQAQQVQAELWLGGYLFYPWPGHCDSPRGAHPQHLRGVWLTRQAWPAFTQQQGGRWLLLPRSAWLAPARASQAECWSLIELNQWLTQLEPQATPVLLARLEVDDNGDWQEVQRLFLVADTWSQEPAAEFESTTDA